MRKLTILKALALLVLALTTTLAGAASPANATGSNSVTITGFSKMHSALKASQKTNIATQVASHAGATKVTCTGYAGHNYLNVSKTRLVKLARARAINVCRYVAHRLGIHHQAYKYVLKDDKNSGIRKVVIRFTGTPVAGRYQYSFGALDPGSERCGGAVTGYFHEGDLVSSTYADGTPLDGSVAPWGEIGTIYGGTSVAFDHWNTSADDSGTSYRFGDHLGPIPAGTTVTLYAIGSTG